VSGPALQDLMSPEHHHSLMELQRQSERQFLARKSAEAELIQLRNAPVPVFTRAPAAPLVLRALARLVPRIARLLALRVLRQSGFVDGPWYLARYRDLAQAKVDPVLHYLLWGGAEERDPGPHFCTAHYVQLYPDVKNSGINPLLHYLQSGWQENRKVFPAPQKPAAPKPVAAKGPQPKGPQP
jgi:hypothetical protein